MTTQEPHYNYMLRRMKEEDIKMNNPLSNAHRSVWVTFGKEGVHMYPGADSDPKLATGEWDDVSFLGYSSSSYLSLPGAYRGVPR